MGKQHHRLRKILGDDAVRLVETSGRTQESIAKAKGGRPPKKIPPEAGISPTNVGSSSAVAAPDPTPSLAEFICVVLIGLEPVRNATFFLASVCKLLHFFRLHDEAHRTGCARIGNNDPPITHKLIERVAERDGVAL